MPQCRRQPVRAAPRLRREHRDCVLPLVGGAGPDCVERPQRGVAQPRILLGSHLEPVPLQAPGDQVEALILRVHLDDELPDPRPVLVAHTIEHFELSLLDIDLEQIDRLESLLDDVQQAACNHTGCAHVMYTPRYYSGTPGAAIDLSTKIIFISY